jgi:hypothetical protein
MRAEIDAQFLVRKKERPASGPTRKPGTDNTCGSSRGKGGRSVAPPL